MKEPVNVGITSWLNGQGVSQMLDREETGLSSLGVVCENFFMHMQRLRETDNLKHSSTDWTICVNRSPGTELVELVPLFVFSDGNSVFCVKLYIYKEDIMYVAFTYDFWLKVCL